MSINIYLFCIQYYSYKLNPNDTLDTEIFNKEINAYIKDPKRIFQD